MTDEFQPSKHLKIKRTKLIISVNERSHRAIQTMAAAQETSMGVIVDAMVNDRLAEAGVSDDELDNECPVVAHNQMLSRRSLEILATLHAAGKWNWKESMETAIELLAESYGLPLPMPSLAKASTATRERILAHATRKGVSPTEAMGELIELGFEASRTKVL